jgi:hypothetical protein
MVEVLDSILPTTGAQDEQIVGDGSVLRDCLLRGSGQAIMDLFGPMNAAGVAAALREVGFAVSPAVVVAGRSAVFNSVKNDLGAALDLQVDGYGLAKLRASSRLGRNTFAAKATTPAAALDFSPRDFDGDVEAARVIQSLLRAASVSVSILGRAPARERGSLLLIAGQALAKGVQGFGFDGLPGKYQVPLAMADVHDLHQHAAVAVAEASVRTGLKAWASGEKVGELNTWVLDSVQRLLQGSVSLNGAQALTYALASGGVGRHASEVGAHKSVALFAGQGLDVNALPIEAQAVTLGLTLKEPNRIRGQYYGVVVAADHRAALVKVSRADVLALPFTALPNVAKNPAVGDSVRVGFKACVMAVNVVERGGRGGSTR